MPRLRQYIIETAPVTVPTVVAVPIVTTLIVVPILASFQYQSIAQPVPLPETVTVDKWHQPLSRPQARQALPQEQSVAFTGGADPIAWNQPLQQPQRRDYRNPASGTSFIAVVTTPEDVTLDKWYRPISGPVRQPLQAATGGQYLAFVPPQPTPGTGDVLFTASPIVVPWQGSFQYQSAVQPVQFAAPETVTLDKWYRPLSEPARRASRAQGQLAFVPLVAAAPTVNVDSWFAPLSVPKSGGAQAISIDVSFAVDDATLAWAQPLSVPKKARSLGPYLPALSWNTETPAVVPPTPGTGDVLFSSTALIVPYQRSFQYQSVANPVPIVAPEVVTVDKWFHELSQPQVPRYQTINIDVSFAVDDTLLTTWYRPLSEPVRRGRPLPAYLPAASWNPNTPAPPSPGTGDVLFSVTEVIVPWQASFQYQSIGQPTPFNQSGPNDVLMSTWFQQLSAPVKGRLLYPALQLSFTTDPTTPIPTPPTPTTGDFTVSGSTVMDRFTTTGVTYTYAPITRRTN